MAADFGILELFLMAILMVITFYTFYTFDNYFTYYTCYTLFLTFSPPVECSRQCASYLFRELVPRVYECSDHTCPAPSTALLSGGEPQSLPQPHVLRTEANAYLGTEMFVSLESVAKDSTECEGELTPYTPGSPTPRAAAVTNPAVSNFR